MVQGPQWCSIQTAISLRTHSAKGFHIQKAVLVGWMMWVVHNRSKNVKLVVFFKVLALRWRLELVEEVSMMGVSDNFH